MQFNSFYSFFFRLYFFSPFLLAVEFKFFSSFILHFYELKEIFLRFFFASMIFTSFALNSHLMYFRYPLFSFLLNPHTKSLVQSSCQCFLIISFGLRNSFCMFWARNEVFRSFLIPQIFFWIEFLSPEWFWFWNEFYILFLQFIFENRRKNLIIFFGLITRMCIDVFRKYFWSIIFFSCFGSLVSWINFE